MSEKKKEKFILIQPYQVEIMYDSSNNIDSVENTITNITSEWIAFKV